MKRDPARQNTRSAAWATASLALCMLLSSMGVSIANIALPSLADAFAAPFGAVQWIVLAYLLAITAAVVSAGRLGDLLGHKPVLLAGLVMFTAASLLCSLAPTLALLITARAVQGLGAAILMAVTVALVRGTVPEAQTGAAMGLLGTMSAVGTALGPTLGGVLIAGFGWRAIFLVMLPLGLIALGLAWRCLPAPMGTRPEPARREGFDGPGTILLGLTLAAYALGMTTGSDAFDTRHLAMLLAAAVGLALFVLHESRAASPLIQLEAFRDPVLNASLAMNALVTTVMMATLLVGPFFLARSLGLGAAETGLVMSVGPVISIISGVPAGRMVDWLGARRVATLGLVAMAVGAAGLALLPALAGIAGFIAAIALLTPGYQLFQAANNTSVMMTARADQRGVLSGLLSLSRNLGLVTGASVMGSIFAAAAGRADLANAGGQAIASGREITVAAAAGFLLAAIAIGLGCGALSVSAGRHVQASE
jgi:EmrB/QacA subfamily drug resistance transporter